MIWKAPDRRYHQVGWFEDLGAAGYRFTYQSHVEQIPGFAPLVQFPDLDKEYRSSALPAFFANRVMSRRRESYGEYLHWLGLELEAPPVEILARSGGGRATDTFHLVDAFDIVAGKCEGRFFVSGIRHKHAEGVVASLPDRYRLTLRDDANNEVNPRAVVLDASGTEIGWIPDWLVDSVHDLRSQGPVTVMVDQINPDAPPHLRLLCRLEATLAE